jgi:ATP adenylyltransferase
MDRLWTPWRYRYVSSITGETTPDRCIFCIQAAAGDDEAYFIVHRAQHNFVMLNKYPYTNGHVLIAPYEHVAKLSEARPEALTEMMQLAVRCEVALRALYNPDGVNLGMNLGEAAGAGVAGHIHLHMLPRWSGDASFMSTVAETRILPEELALTYKRMKAALL